MIDGLRPSVLRFARLMEEALRMNDHKGGWGKETVRDLMRRMREETTELQIACGEDRPWEEVQSEAADVANFAMMIAERYEATHQ